MSPPTINIVDENYCNEMNICKVLACVRSVFDGYLDSIITPFVGVHHTNKPDGISLV